MSTLFGHISPLVFTHYLSSLRHLRLTSPNEAAVAITGTLPALRQLETLNLAYTSLTAIEVYPDRDIVFTNLEELSLAYMDALTDFNPTGLLQTSTKLRVLNISGCSFPIRTPIAISTLTHLIADNLQSSLQLFTQFWEMNLNLQYLSARKAALFGSFSRDIGAMKRLEYLDLTETSLSGKIPASIVQCPLKVLRLSNTRLYPPLPPDIGQLSSTLVELELSEMFGFIGSQSALPQSIGELTNLTKLSLYALGLKGSLPSSLTLFTQLEYFNVSNNGLTGQLPDFGGGKPLYFDARNNLFSGTIPPTLLSRAVVLNLGNNAFQGQLPADILLNNKALTNLVLAHNRLSGPLPNISSESVLQLVDLSGNHFYGPVPTSYCAASELYLHHNHLSSLYDLLETERCQQHLEVLEIGNNQLIGSVPTLLGFSKLRIFSASTNQLSGIPPRLSPSVRVVDLSVNQLEDLAADFWMLTYRSLTHLDLSYNPKLELVQGVIEQLLGPNLTSLSLSHIYYGTSTEFLKTGETYPSLRMLDLSASKYTGVFPTHLFPNLVTLKIASNRFESMAIERLQSLAYLDISKNLFEFEVGRLSTVPGLSIVNARENRIFGSLTLDSLSQLQSIDLSSNKLDNMIDLASIGSLFTSAQLKFLNISDNTALTTLTTTNANLSALTRTTSSAPSVVFPDSLICYGLSFDNGTGQTLLFDEPLFSYMQCDCNQWHFGIPPQRCHKCPAGGASSCGGREAVINPNFFAFISHGKSASSRHSLHDDTGAPAVSSLIDSVWPFTALFTSDTSPSATHSDSEMEHLVTESCLVTTVQTLSGRSNCIGIRLTDKNLTSSNQSLSNILTAQCREGSEGRLCARCSCKSSGTRKCFYESGATCVRCSYVFPLSTSIPFAIALFLLITIVMTVVMTSLLRRKRKQSLKPFNDLPLWKRFFYRFLYLISLGHVSILITFLQLLIAFTEWDAYARLGFLGIINGGSEGYVPLFSSLLSI